MQQKSWGGQLWRIAGPLLIQYLIGALASAFVCAWLLGGMYPELAKVLTDNTATMELSNQLMTQLMQYTTEISTVAAFVTIPVMYFWFHRDRNKEKLNGVIQNEKVKLWKYIFVLGLGIVICFAMNNLVVLSTLAFYRDMIPEASEITHITTLAVQVLGTGLLMPISEELIFRGLIYKRFRETSSAQRAMVYSAVIYGLYNGSILQGAISGVFGYLLAYVYEKYGSIKAPILAHVVMGVTTVLASEAGVFNWIFASPMRVGIVTVVCAAGASSLFVMIRAMGENPIAGEIVKRDDKYV